MVVPSKAGGRVCTLDSWGMPTDHSAPSATATRQHANASVLANIVREVPSDMGRGVVLCREFVDYKTSMMTGEDPLRGLLFY